MVTGSKDGTRLVVRATNGQGEVVAFAYDIPARRKFPDIKLTNLSGRAFCANATFDGCPYRKFNRAGS